MVLLGSLTAGALVILVAFRSFGFDFNDLCDDPAEMRESQ